MGDGDDQSGARRRCTTRRSFPTSPTNQSQQHHAEEDEANNREEEEKTGPQNRQHREKHTATRPAGKRGNEAVSTEKTASQHGRATGKAIADALNPPPMFSLCSETKPSWVHAQATAAHSNASPVLERSLWVQPLPRETDLLFLQKHTQLRKLSNGLNANPSCWKRQRAAKVGNKLTAMPNQSTLHHTNLNK